MSGHAQLLPGTLDLLILKAVSLGPLHGYGILLRIGQISEQALLIEQGALDVEKGETIGFVVETGCHYFAPLAYPETITAALRVAHVGRSSVRYEVALFAEGADTAAAQGHFTHGYVNRADRRPVASLPLALAALATAGCVSHAPRIGLPLRVEADCESRSVNQTAIGSIVASTDDVVRPGTYPGDAALRKRVRAGGGEIAYWPSQPLRLPRTAAALGENGEYLTLVKVALTNDVDTKDGYRLVWLTFRTAAGEKTVLERAFDVQNVCIEMPNTRDCFCESRSISSN